MKTTKRTLGLALSLLPAALMAQGLELTPAQQTLVAEIPTTGAARAREIFTALDKDADTLVPMFAAQLTTKVSDADTTARYALGGLVWTIGHSGSPEQKDRLAKLIAGSIAKVEGTEPKSFLIEQLQFLGQDSIADTLYPLMTDKDLGVRAIRTLAGLKPKELGAKALAALDDASTTEIKSGLLLTVAAAAPKGAAGKVTPFAKDENVYVRSAALDALAAIGDVKSREVIKEAAGRTETFEDKLGPARYLDYAKRLAANGQKGVAAEICNEIADMKHSDDTRYLIEASLSVLADIQGEKALDALFKHVNDDAEDVRAGVLATINRFDSADVSRKLTAALEKAPDPEVSVAILLALGDRKDAKTLPAVTAKLTDSISTVGTTAAAAAGEIDRPAALQAYLDALKSVSDEAVVKAIVDQLRRVKGEVLLPAIVAAYPAASPANQAQLIALLGERRAASQKQLVYDAAKSDNQAVRSAAYEALGRVAQAEDLPVLRDMMLSASRSSDRTAARKALVSAAKESSDGPARVALLTESFAAADEKGKISLLETMAAVADKNTLQTVMDAAQSSASADLQDEAVRALSEWQSEDVLPMLQEIAGKKGVSEKQQVLAVRGITRLAGATEDKSKKLDLLKQALPLAKRPDERKAVLTLLGESRTTRALEMVSPYVDDESVAAEAMAAAIRIAVPDNPRDKGVTGALAVDTLTRGLPAITDEKQRKAVEKYIYSAIRDVYAEALPVDSEGFELLFNGKNLDGWCGALDGYAVEDGVLVCKKDGGGKLFTEREYGDFVLKLEFKIQNGANNGVAIRSPMTSDPAYSGMEIQILDDKDPQYKDIKDWQRHGSVYGVAAAKPTNLKIGEWNTEEISCVGRNIKVTVNGEVINEVNLDEAKAKGYPSDKPHPGADRNNGHIGFLGHGHRVEFRNIRIKNVGNTAPEGFTALFNGKNLEGWKGLVANPIKRKQMNEEQLKAAQAKADKEMNDHWKVENEVLFFDGEGSHLCTTKDYGNFEMLVDWCIPPGGDNGIYLRGTPQVQIWDPHYWPEGSGGLYNNQKTTSSPLVMADNPIGQWNNFRIKMEGELVTVHLNDKLVVDKQPLENYWDRNSPIFPVEQLELQSHGSPAWFRNVYVKELP